ncbi:MAG: murein biosynthesis integral membrane protein MurJ, partial [Candidatus Peregrinibacteria bacterium]
MKVKPFIPATLLLAFSALFSRLLGIVRDHLLASTFGATTGQGIYNLDTYYAAFRIPDMLYNLLIFGAISAAFIPIFTKYRKEGDEESAWAFANSMLHVMLLGVIVLAGIAYLFAPQLTHLVAAGFSPGDFETTTRLMRIMLLSPMLFSIASVLVSIQDSYRHFFFRSLAPIFYNLGIIFAIVKWGGQFGVTGVTWGVILGAALQLIVQLPALKLVHFRYKPVLGWRRPDVRNAFKLMGPRVLGLSLSQITMMVTTLIASFLATGSITIFYLADNLQNLPIGLIGISFAITSFATLSELASEPTPEAFTLELRRVMQAILFLIIPATVGMLLLRHEIVDVILLAGKFTAQDAELT